MNQYQGSRIWGLAFCRRLQNPDYSGYPGPYGRTVAWRNPLTLQSLKESLKAPCSNYGGWGVLA